MKAVVSTTQNNEKGNKRLVGKKEGLTWAN